MKMKSWPDGSSSSRKSPSTTPHAVPEAPRRDVLAGQGRGLGQLEDRGAQMGIVAGEAQGVGPRAAAHVEDGGVLGQRQRLRQGGRDEDGVAVEAAQQPLGDLAALAFLEDGVADGGLALEQRLLQPAPHLPAEVVDDELVAGVVRPSGDEVAVGDLGVDVGLPALGEEAEGGERVEEDAEGPGVAARVFGGTGGGRGMPREPAEEVELDRRGDDLVAPVDPGREQGRQAASVRRVVLAVFV